MSDKHGRFNVAETDQGKLLVQDVSTNQKEIDVPQAPYLTVNGAWYLDAYPTEIITEMVDGTLRMFRLTPFRKITESELRPYKTYHPRKMKGQPLPEYLYKFYGLERNQETLSEVLRVRVSPSEKEKLEATAANAEKTTSEYIRDWVRSL